MTINGEDQEIIFSALTPPEPDTQTVTMTVTDAETGEPIEGARFEDVGDRHPTTGDAHLVVETGADGVGTGEGYEDGYDGVLRADGYEGQSESIGLEEDTDVSFEMTPEETEPESEPESVQSDPNNTEPNTTNGTIASA